MPAEEQVPVQGMGTWMVGEKSIVPRRRDSALQHGIDLDVTGGKAQHER